MTVVRACDRSTAILAVGPAGILPAMGRTRCGDSAQEVIDQARRPVVPQVRHGESVPWRTGCVCYVMPRWKKHCPESVRSFVVLIKNEINNDEAKYEHADNDAGKTRENSWLF